MITTNTWVLWTKMIHKQEPTHVLENLTSGQPRCLCIIWTRQFLMLSFYTKRWWEQKVSRFQVGSYICNAGNIRDKF